MKVACFLLAFCLAFIYKADCQITAWSKPQIDTGDGGNGALDETLAEDAAEGVDTVTITATHTTTAATYILKSQTPTTGGTFTIASDTGVLSFTGTFDFETDPEYELIIEATETNGAVTNTGTATVTLSITDINDINPVFGASSYAFCISDLAAADTVLATVTATDADGTAANNAISAYAITGTGNTNTDFAVSASGVITAANMLNKTATAGYAFTLEATDSGTSALTGTTEVFVYVGTCGCSGAAALVSGAIITTMTVLVARFL